jgi:hypothetical protein
LECGVNLTKDIEMLKNAYVKNILSALAVTVFGFMLLNLTFIFDYLLTTLISLPVQVFSSTGFEATNRWFPPLTQLIFVIVIAVISRFVFKSKLGEIHKAVFSTAPAAVTFAIIGIALNRWPVIAYGVSALVLGAVLVYLYRARESWVYYYAVILVAWTLLIMDLTGTEI